MINVRAETLGEKPAFKNLLGTRRCLVLADGFYEWRKEGKGKVPMRFILKSGNRSRSPAYGIAGNNRMEIFSARTRLSRRNPTTCYPRSITVCPPC